MELNVHFLKTFITLVEVKSFTKTAQKLNMTQPGVSQHIKWLEEYFNTQLLNKFGKKFELTAEGKKVYEYALALFSQHDHFLESFKVDHPYEGMCRLSSPGSFGMKMYSFLLEYNKKFPDLCIHYFYAPNMAIEKDLLADQIDIGFMSVAPKDPSLTATAIDKEKLMLVVPSRFRGEEFSDLLELGFIYHPDGPVMAHELLSLNYPKEYRGMDQIKMKGANNQITRILEPVALGLGFTVLPEFACLAFKNQKAIRYLPLKKEIVGKIYAVKKKFRPLPSRYDKILEHYSNLVNEKTSK